MTPILRLTPVLETNRLDMLRLSYSIDWLHCIRRRVMRSQARIWAVNCCALLFTALDTSILGLRAHWITAWLYPLHKPLYNLSTRKEARGNCSATRFLSKVNIFRACGAEKPMRCGEEASSNINKRQLLQFHTNIFVNMTTWIRLGKTI